MLVQVISDVSPSFNDPPIYIPSIDHNLQIDSFVALQDSDMQEPTKKVIIRILHVLKTCYKRVWTENTLVDQQMNKQTKNKRTTLLTTISSSKDT